MALYPPFNYSPLLILVNRNNYKPTDTKLYFCFFTAISLPPITPHDIPLHKLHNIYIALYLTPSPRKILLLPSILKYLKYRYRLMWHTHKLNLY